MIRKSGNRFSEKPMIEKKLAPAFEGINHLPLTEPAPRALALRQKPLPA
jgi:hypothetical protein